MTFFKALIWSFFVVLYILAECGRWGWTFMFLIESSGLLLPLTFQWSLSQMGLQSPTQRCCWQASETGARAEECFSWRALDSGTQRWCTDQGRGVWACVCICKILCVSKVWNAATQTNPQELIVITRYVWKVTFTSLVLPCAVVKLKILKTKPYVYFPAVRFSDNLSVLRLKLH